MAIDQKQYIIDLESELEASLEREEKLLSGVSTKEFIKNKIKKTRLYRSASNPNSKPGKVLRAPRTAYRLISNPEVFKEFCKKKAIINPLEPWVIPVEERAKIVQQAIKSGKSLALYYEEKPNSSTFRYRCFNTMQTTISSKKWQATYFFKDEVDVLKSFLPKSKLLIIGRQNNNIKILTDLISCARQHECKIILDIDDLVFDMKYFDTVINTINGNNNKGYWLTYFAKVRQTAEKVDGFITTNYFLGKKLTESFKRPFQVIPNSLNSEQLAASMVYTKIKQNYHGKVFSMGYFSGSPTHVNDFKVIKPELSKLLKKYPNITLKVVGYMKFDQKMQKFVDNGQIQFIPPVDFRKLQRLMSEVDVNIAPLVDNVFTNCKSELKFFEAAAVETTTIASPTYTFKNSIKHGKTGFLCKPGEWYDTILDLYKHPEKNRKIALAAKKYCLENYYGEKFLKQVEEAYDYFAN